MLRNSKWFIFTLVAIAQFMVVLDVAITNVALPAIKHNLQFQPSSLQWVVTAYALCFGGFLLLGGRAADLFGRKKMLLVGMAAFTTFSLLIGLSVTAEQLIVLRALQGVSAAFMSPAALSIVLVTFRDGIERGKALGYWTLVASGGAAVGMILGGILTEYFGWRWNFFINVPLGLVMLALIGRFIPLHEKEEQHAGLDVTGALLITASIMTQVFAFSQASTWGWLDGKTIGLLAAGLVMLGVFLLNEAYAKAPLMPLSILKVRNLIGANIIMVPLYATMMGTFYLDTLYLQGILHFSPLAAGFSFLPFPIILGVMSTQTPKFVARFGYRRFLIVGPLVIAMGLLWLSFLQVHDSYLWRLLPALIVTPFGVGLTMMPIFAAATAGVPAHESGLASGLISTSQQMGGALGLSILSGVAASATASATRLGPASAMVYGYHVAFLVGAAFMVVASVIALVVIRQKRPGSSA